MLFACLRAPTHDGATALADSPTVFHALPTELIERFEQQGWLLTRNYNDEIGASLAEAFGTPDRGAIESYCRANLPATVWRAGRKVVRWRQRGGSGSRNVGRGSACGTT